MKNRPHLVPRHLWSQRVVGQQLRRIGKKWGQEYDPHLALCDLPTSGVRNFKFGTSPTAFLNRKISSNKNCFRRAIRVQLMVRELDTDSTWQTKVKVE